MRKWDIFQNQTMQIVFSKKVACISIAALKKHWRALVNSTPFTIGHLSIFAFSVFFSGSTCHAPSPVKENSEHVATNSPPSQEIQCSRNTLECVFCLSFQNYLNSSWQLTSVHFLRQFTKTENDILELEFIYSNDLAFIHSREAIQTEILIL